MAHFSIASLMTLAFVALTMVIVFPTGAVAEADFPYFYRYSQPYTVCDRNDKSFARTLELKPSSMSDCDVLLSSFKSNPGQYEIGGFGNHDAYMSIGTFRSCSLSFKATDDEDAANEGKWFIGSDDAAKLITDSMNMAFVEGSGAAEGTIPCHYHTGGLKALFWRVSDDRK